MSGNGVEFKLKILTIHKLLILISILCVKILRKIFCLFLTRATISISGDDQNSSPSPWCNGNDTVTLQSTAKSSTSVTDLSSVKIRTTNGLKLLSSYLRPFPTRDKKRWRIENVEIGFDKNVWETCLVDQH